MSESEEPKPDKPTVYDKRRIDPETGEARIPPADISTDKADDTRVTVGGPDDGIDTVGDVSEVTDEELEALLAPDERDLLVEYREIAARAQADLKNFRTRVERDRAANRQTVIAEVIRSLLPVIDDLDLAEAHGDLLEGTPVTLIAQKLRSSFDRYGLRRVGEVGEIFDPSLHEAVAQLPEPDTDTERVKDVIQIGYALGERLIRAAKVAVSVPAPEENG